MDIFFLPLPAKNQKDAPGNSMPVPAHEPRQNTNGGSEFPDDVMRMEFQPVMHTEESIAAGSPENFL